MRSQNKLHFYEGLFGQPPHFYEGLFDQSPHFYEGLFGQPLHFYEGLSTKTRVSHIESTYKKCLREE